MFSKKHMLQPSKLSTFPSDIKFIKKQTHISHNVCKTWNGI